MTEFDEKPENFFLAFDPEEGKPETAINKAVEYWFVPRNPVARENCREIAEATMNEYEGSGTIPEWPYAAMRHMTSKQLSA